MNKSLSYYERLAEKKEISLLQRAVKDLVFEVRELRQRNIAAAEKLFGCGVEEDDGGQAIIYCGHTEEGDDLD
jgi:hypothetical protein